ncbi:hypothetical protein D3C74_413000 [compost metagenome]
MAFIPGAVVDREGGRIVLALQEPLGQRRTLIGKLGFLADQRQRSRIAALSQFAGNSSGGQAATGNDDRFHAVSNSSKAVYLDRGTRASRWQEPAEEPGITRGILIIPGHWGATAAGCR